MLLYIIIPFEMLANVAVCPLASFILVLVVIINVLDIYLVGFHFAILLTNLLISVFFVWLANKTCEKYHWVSWLITAYFVICIIGALTLIMHPPHADKHVKEGFFEGAKGDRKKKKNNNNNNNN